MSKNAKIVLTKYIPEVEQKQSGIVFSLKLSSTAFHLLGETGRKSTEFPE